MIIVTGGNSGLGKEITDNLISNGENVITISRSNLPDNENHISCDLTNFKSLKKAYKKTSIKKLFLQKKNIYIKKNNIKTISSILKITKKHCNKTNKPRLLTYCKEEDGTLRLNQESNGNVTNASFAKCIKLN